MTTEATVLIVRDSDAWRTVTANDWDVTTLLACVSSDPRTFSELCLAWQRYRENEPLEDLPWRNFVEVPDDPVVANWVLVDLASQCLETNVEDYIPDEHAGFVREEGEWMADNPVVWFNLPPSWQRIISSRPPAPALLAPAVPNEPLDYRGVLFGRAVAEDFAARMESLIATAPRDYYCWDDLPWEMDRDDPRRGVANRWHALTVHVHAGWLMTPRDDLGGESPRVFLHRGRAWVDREVQNRSHAWSKLRTPPRPLDRDTFAYAHGPMGTDEVVVYFDFCRVVLHAGWRLLVASREVCKDTGRWAAEMYDHGRCWLEEGQIDGCSTAPAEIIESCRRQMPRLADGTHLDCECPLCRMIADDQNVFGPTFSGFDGHHLELDHEFAFSLYETLEEWEEEQSAYARLNERIGPEQSDSESDEDSEVWRGYVNSELVGVSAISLGFRLTELIGDLKCQEQSVECIMALNDAFDSVRKSPPTLSDRRIAADTMKDKLERVAAVFPDLVSKSADLQSELDQWLRQLPPDEVSI